MKVWAKINRGAALTLAVLLAVAGYLIVLTSTHRADRPAIERICEKYIQSACDYSVLPAAYRKDNPAMPQAELDSYLNKLSTDIGSYYPSDDAAKYTVSQMRSNLQAQAKGSSVVFKYEKDISHFNSLEFDGDSVTVTIVCNTSIETKGAYSGAEHNTGSGQTTDTLALQKKDGEWKVVYADLAQPSPANGYDKTMIYK